LIHGPALPEIPALDENVQPFHVGAYENELIAMAVASKLSKHVGPPIAGPEMRFAVPEEPKEFTPQTSHLVDPGCCN
jgi:hypothetical protein